MFNQTWYQDAPIHHLYVYQISRQLDNPFPLYGYFHAKTKRRRKKNKNNNNNNKKKKPEETKPDFESLYLGNAWRDLVEIWNVGY